MAAKELSNNSTPRSVKRALDAMRRDVGHDWTAEKLAAAAGVANRTLQRQFLNTLGKSPQAVLRDIRLELARRKLSGDLRDERIMDIALACGFPHFGRFSVAYRRRYGETPSQTVKRQAGLTDGFAPGPSFITSGRHRPQIALPPIDATSENAEAARHIAAELATALTRSGISVTDQDAAPYTLTGAIRRLDRHTSLTFRLIETRTGRHLWAHRSERELDELDIIDQHLSAGLVGALCTNLHLVETDRASRRDVDLAARDLVLRAMPGVLALDAEGNGRALDLLERARECDPDDALATALAAWVHGQRVVYHLTVNRSGDRARGLDLAHKAQSLAANGPAFAILGNAFSLLQELDTAELFIRRALSIDGASAWAWSRSGWIDLYKGDAESAVEQFRIALDLAPHDPLAFNSMVGLGCAHFHAGRYAEAARWQERALVAHPSAAWVHRTLCSAHMLNGAVPQARRSLNALRQQYPELTVSEVQSGMPPLPETYRALVLDALHSAGLPL